DRGGRHPMNARRRGGLGPSNAAAAPRAFLLIAVAVVIGLVLLWKGLDSTPGTVAPAEAPVVAEKSTDESPVDQGSDTSADETSAAAVDTSSDQPATTEAPAPTTTEDPFPKPTYAPNEVKVLVANGSGVSGAAGKVTDMLTPLGWAMESPANADKSSISGIYYKTGYAHNARLIQDHFGEDPSILSQFPSGGLAVPDRSLDRVENAHIVIILGSDLAIQGG
ncbi:MAG: LytR C-terminal domain-containing protein, partial [Acidimicrobiales bacterium]|nr:LytR C-terminal domain-containing protein [Acidimicrobiales bacterium]